MKSSTYAKNSKKKMSPEQLINQALEQHQQGNLIKTEELIKKALKITPNVPDYLHFLGLIKHQQKNSEDGLTLIKKAISINNSNTDYLYNLGVILKSLNRIEDAIHYQKQALALSPSNIHYSNEIALLYTEINEFSQAKHYLNASLSYNGNHATTYSNLSFVFRKENNIKEAIKYANLALELDPSLSTAHMNLGQSYAAINDIEDGVKHIKKSFLYGNNHFRQSQQSLLLYMLYSDKFTPEEIYTEHCACQTQIFGEKTKSIKPKIKKNSENKKLNIGFISSDFNNHSIIHFLFAIIKHYNKSEFNYVIYSGVNKSDEYTNEMKDSVDQWREIYNKDENAIIHQIKADNIDILIDLAGHTTGNYLNILYQKPAPIQITFLGYPFSTGMKQIDYRITDLYADPEGMTEHIHSEKLLRISPSFLCYKPRQNITTNSTVPYERNAFITFGSFNNFNKLSPTILKIWASILKTVSHSRLVLKNNRPIPDLLHEKILSTFLNEGIDISRIDIIKPLNKIPDHMALYNEIDICLDSYPYNGTTTTFEALSMGIPVISLAGNAHPSRVGNSILNNLKLEEYIANNSNNYINIAKKLANDINTLKYLRQDLPKRLSDSILTDGKKYALSFDNALRRTWVNYIQQPKES